MPAHTTELSADAVIIGGGTGGVAAALALASRGRTCIVVEPTDWVGGQLTAQAVPADENQWIETHGGTCSYLDFRERVRRWYREHRPLTPEARASERLNPGNGWVSRLCCEPRIAHSVLRDLLAPHLGTRVRLLLEHDVVSAGADADRVRAVTVRERATGSTIALHAKFFLDASETGDLLALAGVEHSIGAEGAGTFGELHGRPGADDPMDQQAFSWCFALEHRPGEDHTIPRPARYDFWRSYVPQTTPAWTGPLFSWTIPTHNEAGRRVLPMVPWPDRPADNQWELWRYRRIVDRALYTPGPDAPPDVTLVNWVQMDYWLKPLLGVDDSARAAALDGARELSRCFLHWMQTEAPRHDDPDRAGYPGLRLRGDELGTADGFAKAPYIREPRRLVARTVVTEAHVGTEQRRAERRPHMDQTPFGTGEAFADSVGIGHYPIDLHPSVTGRNSVYVPAAPFRIPMGALVPVRMRNVLAAGKCLGVTHVANGCFRLHPVEWNVGESAGHLAAWCVERALEPQQVHASPDHVREFQEQIAAAGVRLNWPWEK